MLLMPNKKKVATLIVGSMRKPSDSVQRLGESSGTGKYDVPEGEDSDKDVAVESAMQDLIDAIDAKDAKAAAKAFKTAVYLCDDDDQVDDGEAD